MEYRQSGDLTLKENSEVAVTLIGSNTCWNNTIGYYYYKEGQEPKNLKDIHVIMLFPNTQDGHSEYIAKYAGGRYYGNIALDRGDEVKLMYYPHIASNDMSDATPEFPAGTCIGFLLKSNGWAMQLPQGDKVFHNGYIGTLKDSKISRQYNCWAASTDGLSYCPECPEQNIADVRSVALPNPDGVSRTAKFAYQNEQGQQYAIVSFEDAANDEDYGDKKRKQYDKYHCKVAVHKKCHDNAADKYDRCAYTERLQHRYRRLYIVTVGGHAADKTGKTYFIEAVSRKIRRHSEKILTHIIAHLMCVVDSPSVRHHVELTAEDRGNEHERPPEENHLHIFGGNHMVDHIFKYIRKSKL